MNNKEIKETQEMVADQPQAEPVAQAAQPEQKITLSKEELKNMIDEAIAKVRTEEHAKKAQEYNAKMEEMVRSSQASVMKPNLAMGETHVQYVERILEEDKNMRMKNPDGKHFIDVYEAGSLEKAKIWSAWEAAKSYDPKITKEQFAQMYFGSVV